MERRGSNTWLIAALAIACGFLVAVLLFRGGSDNASSTVGTTTVTGANTDVTTTAATGTTTSGTGTTTTSATTTTPAPQETQRSVGDCVNLWNAKLNRGDQTFLLNVMSQQPVRVHVGLTSDVPPKCEVTIVGNNGTAYVFPEAGGTTYPYAQGPGITDAKTLPAGQKTSNALEQSDGTLAAR